MKKLLLVLLIIFLLLQLIPREKNISATASATDIHTAYSVPADVDAILKKACNDCHTDNTRYPWYNNVQPVAWWLAGHVKDGKRHLNFSTFTSMKVAVQDHKLEEIIEQVETKEMPLKSYTWAHADARLTDAERATLVNWAKKLRADLRLKYPADSLVVPPRK